MINNIEITQQPGTSLLEDLTDAQNSPQEFEEEPHEWVKSLIEKLYKYTETSDIGLQVASRLAAEIPGHSLVWNNIVASREKDALTAAFDLLGKRFEREKEEVRRSIAKQFDSLKFK